MLGSVQVEFEAYSLRVFRQWTAFAFHERAGALSRTVAGLDRKAEPNQEVGVDGLVPRGQVEEDVIA
ncbi:MAG TPA: hypothetical protein VMM14_09410 [Acidimicrobiia bacterium]|nr:hypothetical protein [Acidimicrobiia bacterium]